MKTRIIHSFFRERTEEISATRRHHGYHTTAVTGIMRTAKYRIFEVVVLGRVNMMSYVKKYGATTRCTKETMQLKREPKKRVRIPPRGDLLRTAASSSSSKLAGGK